MNNLLRYIIETFFDAWSNSEYFARVVGYFLITFTTLVFGFIMLSKAAHISPVLIAPFWRVFWGSVVVTWAYLYFVRPPI